MHRTTATCALCLFGLSSAASAYPVQFTADQTSSVVGADICLAPPGLAQQCDTISSAVTGTIELDFAGFTPTTVSIADFDLHLIDDPSYTLSWGSSDNIAGQLSGAHLLHADPGVPTPPATIDAGGSFNAETIPLAMAGTASLVGSLNSIPVDETVDLSLNDPSTIPATGSILITGRDALLIIHMPFDVHQDTPAGPLSINGVTTIIARGTIPLGCTIDLNNDGLINFGDVTTFVDAFIAGDLVADVNNDTLINFADVTAFIDAFLAGCP